MRRIAFALALVALVSSPASAQPAPGAADAKDTAADAPLNVALPTLGGKQVWADELLYGEWRIQRNALTGHCRLLDEHDVRQGWGNYDQCVALLERFKTERNLQPARGRVVLVLHGLTCCRTAMFEVVRHLEENTDYTVLTVGYPSVLEEVDVHAAALANIVDHLPEATQIDFVAHSLGNLVIRHYLADSAAAAGGVDPRIKRIVMIGPPNQGASWARLPGVNAAATSLGGASGAQLALYWDDLKKRLADAPENIEVGIIAGGTGLEVGLNPLLAGDNDGVVCVAETRLDGAVDYCLIKNMHALLIFDDDALDRTLHFLRTGCFAADNVRHAHPMVAHDIPVRNTSRSTQETIGNSRPTLARRPGK